MGKEKPPTTNPTPKDTGITIATSASYTIEGKRFEVERVFQPNAQDTIGTVLLKLIRLESETL